MTWDQFDGYTIFWTIVGFGLFVALVVHIVRKSRKTEDASVNPPSGVDFSERNGISTPSVDGVSNGVSAGDPPPTPKSAATATRTFATLREKEDALRLEKIKAGVCYCCNEPARHQQPLRVRVRSVVLDWIYLKLGATPPARYQLRLWFTDAPYVFCGVHLREAERRMALKMSSMESALREFELRQLMEMDEYEKYGLHEEMAGQQTSVLRGATKPPLPRGAS